MTEKIINLKGKYANKNVNIAITLELKNNKENNPCFSTRASVELQNANKVLLWGQCLDSIKQYVTFDNDNSKDLFTTIHTLWRKHHLNDMHADCEHAINEKQANKQLVLYTYTYKGDSTILDNKLKLIKTNSYFKSIKFNKKIKTYLKYGFSFKSEFKLKHFNKEVQALYEMHKWDIPEYGAAEYIYYNKELTPSGILRKPCPICGYKYGTAWKYRTIPKKDLNTILALIQNTKL